MATLRVKVSTIDKESRYNTASDGPYTPATLSSAATPVGFFRKKKKENRCPPGKRRRLNLTLAHASHSPLSLTTRRSKMKTSR